MKTIISDIVAIVLLMNVLACSSKKETMKEDRTNNPLPDMSIYNANSLWKKQDGSEFSLKSLRGKVVVTAMVFTNCGSACPRITADMQRIERTLTDDERTKTIFLLLSMDPERDTPQQCTAFSNEMKLSERWIVAATSRPSTDEIANILGVKIKKLSGGGFDHSNTIFVLNADGEIAHTQDGLEQEPTQTIETIKKLTVTI